MASTALSPFDSRPFFDKALRYGVQQRLISAERLQTLQQDFAKGIVQIANFFGTAHLRPDLELALRRISNLISLYLEDLSGGDLPLAAASLRDKSLLSHSKAGSDMLKRLHALPESTLMIGRSVSAEDQRAYLDMMTAADGIALAEYLAEAGARQANQRQIDFAFWLARKMGVPREDMEEAEAFIRSAMLALFADQAAPGIPTRSVFVRLIKAAKNPKARLDEARLKAFLQGAPMDFQALTKAAMQRFIEKDLPQIRSSGMTADKLLYGEAGNAYFVGESLDEDVGEYDRLVAKEWHRVTKGDSDDPAVLATVFLFIATGLPPKASLLQREGRDVIRNFRSNGFDSRAVAEYVNQHAPVAIQEDLHKFWQEDLKSEAETQLADKDPNYPDSHMERALEYLRQTCTATWKAPRR